MKKFTMLFVALAIVLALTVGAGAQPAMAQDGLTGLHTIHTYDSTWAVANDELIVSQDGEVLYNAPAFWRILDFSIEQNRVWLGSTGGLLLETFGGEQVGRVTDVLYVDYERVIEASYSNFISQTGHVAYHTIHATCVMDMEGDEVCTERSDPLHHVYFAIEQDRFVFMSWGDMSQVHHEETIFFNPETGQFEDADGMMGMPEVEMVIAQEDVRALIEEQWEMSSGYPVMAVGAIFWEDGRISMSNGPDDPTEVYVDFWGEYNLLWMDAQDIYARTTILNDQFLYVNGEQVFGYPLQQCEQEDLCEEDLTPVIRE